MNLQPTLATTARILFSLSVIALALFLLSQGRFGPATADVAGAAKRLQAVPAPEKMRLFENRISQNLPIRVKIKREKEKRFRDVDNENWARELELEVKNTGDKPIYFLFLHLDVPEAKIRDSYQSFAIVYGRVALSKWEERPTPEDVSIKPGETIVLKIEESQLRGWDQARGHGAVPKRIHGTRLSLDQLSFGDGTGFEGGAPWPRQPNPSQSAYSKRPRSSNTKEGSPS